MDKNLKKSIRNGLYAFIPIALLTFFYGGIYNEMIVEGMGFSLENMMFALIGSIIAGVYIFLPVFVISLIYFYFKTKNSKDN